MTRPAVIGTHRPAKSWVKEQDEKRSRELGLLIAKEDLEKLDFLEAVKFIKSKTWMKPYLWESLSKRKDVTPKMFISVAIDTEDISPWKIILENDELRDYLVNRSFIFKFWYLPKFVKRNLKK